MRALNLSDLLFGIVVAALFALSAFVLFGQAVADLTFWRLLLPILGCVLVVTTMRSPLEKLNRGPRAVSWFAIGFSVAAFVGWGGEHEFSLATAIGFGLALAVFEFVADNYFPKKDADNG